LALTYVNQVGAVEGMNQAAPGTLIPDTFIRWSQDVLFDRAGLIRRRGPFNTAVDSIPTPATASHDQGVIGITSCLNPLNERIIGVVVYGDNNASPTETVANTNIYYYKHNGTTNVKQSGFSTLGANFKYNTKMDSKAALGGGAWIGLLEKYGVSGSSYGTRHALYFWQGGCGTDASKTGYMHINDAKITGIADVSTLTSGMFVFDADDKYIGVVKSISGGEVFLVKRPYRVRTAFAVSPATADTFKFKNVRPYIHRHGRGLLTKKDNTSAASQDVISGDIGTSSEGHWTSANLLNYHLYKNSDNAYLGVVTSTYPDVLNKLNKTLQIDTQGTYVDYTTTMAADEYIAIRHDAVLDSYAIVSERSNNDPAWSGSIKAFTGVFNATYAGLQWFGCYGVTGQTNRVVFSNYHDPEAVDLSKDSADSIIIPGTQEMRGIASSNSGLVVLMEDKVYLIRGNTRANFSLELLYPQGCVCTSSIIETGGGVVWASRAGLLYYDGATVRNLTANNLGVYYSDGLSTFDPQNDTCYSFMYRDYVFFHFSKWNNTYSMVRYEPIYAGDWATSVYNDDNTRVDAGIYAADGLAGQSWASFDSDNVTWDNLSLASNTPLGWDYESEKPASITFAVYLPTSAITTISNFAFRGATFQESVNGLKAFVGFTRASETGIGRRADIVSVDGFLDSTTDGFDHKISDTSTRLGPDLFLQTKHYTVGDPMLKKWFQKLMISFLLERGAVRVDFIDNEDNDNIDVYNLKHKNWEVFTEKGLLWSNVENVVLPKYASPSASTWSVIENKNYTWLSLLFADYERQTKRFSLRQSSIGFRLYQLNNYREVYETAATKPRRIETDAWNIGYKPLRGGRV